MPHVLHMVIYPIVSYNIIKWYGTHCVRNTLFTIMLIVGYIVACWDDARISLVDPSNVSNSGRPIKASFFRLLKSANRIKHFRKIEKQRISCFLVVLCYGCQFLRYHLGVDSITCASTQIGVDLAALVVAGICGSIVISSESELMELLK